jgi:hypothetical protein
MRTLPSVVLLFVALGCSDRPLPIPGADPQGPVPDLVSRACVTAISCKLPFLPNVPPPYGSSVTACLAGWSGLDHPDVQLRLGIDSESLACLTMFPSDCASVRACLQARQPSPSDFCRGNTFYPSSPNEAQSIPFDCGSIGMECSDHVGCNLGPCPAGQSSKSVVCAGDRVAICSYGFLVTQEDCTLSGGTCFTQSNGSAACRGPGASCDPAMLPHCSGNSKVVCEGGAIAVQDCRAAGFNCSQADCVPISICEQAASCDGTVLSVCGPDGTTTIDCAALGFASCDASHGGRCSS